MEFHDDNNRASTEATKINVAPLDVSLRERLVSLLNTVRCNGQQAYSTAYLIGLGAPLSLITSWSVAWSSLDTKMKYYVGTSYDAKQQLRTYDVDFGLVNDGLSEEWVGQMSDAALLPMAAYAMAPGARLLHSFFVLLYFEQQLTRTLSTPAAYNIPQLAGLELVLDFDTIARIYLNEITMWDDPRIQALNSAEVVAVLPSQPIYVITQSVATGLTSLFTTVLNATVPDFAAQVGPARVVECRSQIGMRWLTVDGGGLSLSGGSRCSGVVSGAEHERQSIGGGDDGCDDIAAHDHILVRLLVGERHPPGTSPCPGVGPAFGD
jgi:hypothetical protein